MASSSSSSGVTVATGESPSSGGSVAGEHGSVAAAVESPLGGNDSSMAVKRPRIGNVPSDGDDTDFPAFEGSHSGHDGGGAGGQMSSMTLDMLPLELKLTVLSYVSKGDLTKRVCLVSRDFRDLAYLRLRYIGHDPSVWTELPAKFRLDSSSADALFNRCEMLTKLKLSSIVRKNLSWPLAAAMALQRCSHLAELKLCVDDDEDGFPLLLQVIGLSPSLKKLHLEGEWLPRWLSDNAVCFKRLTEIRMETDCLDGESLVALGRHCQELQSFAYHYGWLDLYGYADDAAMISFLEARKDTLRKLEFDCNRLTDAAFADLGRCRYLHTLRLLSIGHMAGQFMDHVATLRELRDLGLYFDSNVDVNVTQLENFVRPFENRKLRQLTSLEINRKLTDAILSVIVANCPLLNKLTISGCIEVTDRGLSAIADHCGGNLTQLNLAGCGKITDVGLKKVLERCKSLKELSLMYVSGITSGAFNNTTALRKLMIDSLREPCIDRDELSKIKQMLPQLLICEQSYDREWNYDAQGASSDDTDEEEESEDEEEEEEEPEEEESEDEEEED